MDKNQKKGRKNETEKEALKKKLSELNERLKIREKAIRKFLKSLEKENDGHSKP